MALRSSSPIRRRRFFFDFFVFIIFFFLFRLFYFWSPLYILSTFTHKNKYTYIHIHTLSAILSIVNMGENG